MSLQTEWVPEWRDETASSRYPFDDTAALRSTSSPAVVVADGLLLDACLYPSFADVGLYRVLVAADRTITLVFAPATAGATAEAELTPGQTLADVYEGGVVAGVLVLADDWEQAVSAWPAGEHRFDQRRNRLVPAVVKAGPEFGVEGVTDGSLTAGGELWIIADDGVVVRPDGDDRVRVDVVGDPLFRRRRCNPDEAFVTPRFVRTVNGQPPDEYGGFLVRPADGETALRIFVRDGAVRIEVAGAEGQR